MRTITWSKHSRLMDPITLSANGFCQGDRGAVMTSSMPMAKNASTKHAAVHAVPIPDYVAWCRVPREGFADLLRHPRRGWICRHTEMHDPPAIMMEHDEGEEETERRRGHHEEVDRCETAHMVSEIKSARFARVASDGAPCTWTPWPLTPRSPVSAVRRGSGERPRAGSPGSSVEQGREPRAEPAPALLSAAATSRSRTSGIPCGAM